MKRFKCCTYNYVQDLEKGLNGFSELGYEVVQILVKEQYFVVIMAKEFEYV